MKQVLFGKTCFPGIAIGPAVWFRSTQINLENIKTETPAIEIQKLEIAFQKTESSLKILIESQQSDSKDISISKDILEAHLMMLGDPEWKGQTLEFIQQGKSAAVSLKESSQIFKSMLESLDDEYLKARAHDIEDLSYQVLTHLTGQGLDKLKLTEPCILVAKGLLPSEFLSLDKKKLLGLIFENSSNTSHTAILAKTFEIPCIVGVHNLSDFIFEKNLIIMDALKAQIQTEPSLEAQNLALKELESQKEESKNLEIFISKKSISQDHISFEVASNLSCIDDMKLAIQKGTEGCGLFRSEFLLLDQKSMPSEEEQFQTYKTLVQSLAPSKAVIRLFDIGGDKQLPFLQLPKEENPFLGLRGLRLSLSQPDILLKPQLRALLRSAPYGKLAIMAPMVTTLGEVQDFKMALKTCENELLSEGLLSTPPSYEVGIMVEVPAIALILNDLIPHLNFVSVGTNDLIQYLCATDRMNSTVSHLHDAYHPAVLRFLYLISNELKNSTVWMGLCGELAAQNDYVPLLMAMGFKELSVSPGSLLKTRAKVCGTSVEASQKILQLALKAKSSAELKNLLQN